MKKNIAFAFLSLLLIGAAVFAIVKLGPDKYERVNPADKIVLSDSMPISRAFRPSLWTDVYFCDALVQGKIVGIEPVYSELSSGIDEWDQKMAEMSPDGKLPVIVSTEYTLEVEKQFLGDDVGKVIQFREPGGIGQQVTKPEGEEEVVLFLYQNSLGKYTTADGEHSIFTVDEKGRLYSYSNREELSAFDGKPVSVLIEAAKQTKRDIDQELPPPWVIAAREAQEASGDAPPQ